MGMLIDFIPGKAAVKCAVKTASDDATGEERVLFLKEASLMTQLNCHHVVKLLGVVSKTPPTCVIMELMANGDLKKFLRSRKPGPNNTAGPPPTLSVCAVRFWFWLMLFILLYCIENLLKKSSGFSFFFVQQILRMSAEIADGMCYIHSQKLIHRDLAARNCMVTEDMTVKVGDFGMSKEIIDNYYRKETPGRLPVRYVFVATIFRAYCGD